MASICSEVLRTIMPRYMIQTVSYLHLLLAPQRAEHGVNPLLDVVGRELSLDPLQDASLLVVVDQGLRLLAVLREAVLDHLGLVVVTNGQLRPVHVADALLLGWVEFDVIDVARILLAGSTTA